VWWGRRTGVEALDGKHCRRRRRRSLTVWSWTWSKEGGHGSALTCGRNAPSVLVLVHGLWGGAAGPARLYLEGRLSRLRSPPHFAPAGVRICAGNPSIAISHDNDSRGDPSSPRQTLAPTDHRLGRSTLFVRVCRMTFALALFPLVCRRRRRKRIGALVAGSSSHLSRG